MANIRRNPSYNDPYIAQAASNLASLFAPPTGADAAGWATARAKNAEADAKSAAARRLADVYDYARSQGYDRAMADRMAVGAGVYTPSQSYYAVDTGAATSRANNANTVRGGLIGQMYQPLNPGQVRPDVPANIAGIVGLPELAGVAGLPRPLSETEAKAADYQALRANGSLTDQMLLDTILGKETPVQAVGTGGTPVFMSPGAAVRTGAQPYDAKAAGTNAAGAAQLRDAKNSIITEDIGRALQVIAENPRMATGIGSQIMGGVGGTPANALNGMLSTIKANVGFDQLQAMRAASPTGGALGAVSDAENKLLQSVLGNLEASQRPEDLTFNLKRLNNTVMDIVHGHGKGPQRFDLGDGGATASPPAAAATAGTPASPAPTIDPEAINLLRTNPALAPRFDEIFGAGAAQRVLGGG